VSGTSPNEDRRVFPSLGILSGSIKPSKVVGKSELCVLLLVLSVLEHDCD